MCVVKVIGIGAAGIQIINHLLRNAPRANIGAMILSQHELSKSIAESKLLLTPQFEGLNNRDNLQWATEQTEGSKENIERFICSDTVILTAGFGAQSSYTLPLVAQIAHEMKIRTVGVVSLPFNIEGAKRRKRAEEGLHLSRDFVHVLSVINADEVFRGKQRSELSLTEAFSSLDDWMSKTILFYYDLFSAQLM
jgi:cell division protein FtsZ